LLSQLLTLYTTPVIYIYLSRLTRKPERRRAEAAVAATGAMADAPMRNAAE
jgi:hypothetical protein